MDIYDILNAVYGLAIFLFGMKVMGQSLERCTGDRLKTVLGKITSRPVSGAFLGAAVTAAVQSSSVTTVMAIGFVNSGIMELGQSVGIIIGANVGTTITSWFLSLTGIKGDSLFLRLLKPETFTPFLAVFGIILIMFSKNVRKRDIGGVLIGFSVLILGMENMTHAMSGAAESPEIQEILLLFKNPFLGVLCGAAVTAAIQSSSASIGILQALAASGAVSYSNAVPIIIGQNIGTCVTAVFSAVGANKNAKRVAAVHLCFNIIGAAAFSAVCLALLSVFGSGISGKAVGSVEIAVIHSVFNIFSMVLLLPFSRQLERLACFLVPDKGKDAENELLDERLLITPSIALERARLLAAKMAHVSEKNVIDSMALLNNYDKKAAERIFKEEEKVDKYEDSIGTYLVKLAGTNISGADSGECSALLHIIGDIERLSDHAVNIYESALEINEKKIKLSGDTMNDMRVMGAAVAEITKITLSAFVGRDTAAAQHVEPLEETIDAINAKIRQRYISKIQNSEYTMEIGFVLSDLLTNYERIADHCSNIAVCLIEAESGSLGMHEYLSKIKVQRNEDFTREYEFYIKKYQI